jgi:hypothetical protein
MAGKIQIGHLCDMNIDILNPLRPSGNYMNHLLWQSVMLHFVFIGFDGSHC